jgi:hypothetical protein
MSYIINNSRGQIVAVVADGTTNSTATDLTLVGRSVAEYGEFQNENYVFCWKILPTVFSTFTAYFRATLVQFQH